MPTVAPGCLNRKAAPPVMNAASGDRSSGPGCGEGTVFDHHHCRVAYSVTVQRCSTRMEKQNVSWPQFTAAEMED